MNLILLRYGEIGLKGRNRHEFVRRLRRNVRACLKAHGIEGEVVSVGRRVYVRTARFADPGAARAQEALEPLSRVFGLVSLSPAREVARDIEAIVSECVRQAKAAGVRPGVSYRVRARRAWAGRLAGRRGGAGGRPDLRGHRLSGSRLDDDETRMQCDSPAL